MFYRRILLFLFLINTFISVQVYSQKGYKNQLEPGSKMSQSGINFTLEKTKDKKYIYKKYYPETRQMTHLVTYASRKLKIKEGKNSEWMDDGKLWFTGNYRANKKEGEWIEWTSRNFYEKGEYLNGKREGKWINSDPAGTIIRQECHYKANKLDGIYQSFDKEGLLRRKEVYKEGDLIETLFPLAKVLDSLGKIREEMPRFPGCEDLKEVDSLRYAKCTQNAMLQHIYTSIRYPRMARENGIQGKALIRFVVTKEGEIEEIEVLRGVCDAIKEECIRVIQTMPKWHPGYQNGEAVNVFFNMPLRFALQ